MGDDLAWDTGARPIHSTVYSVFTVVMIPGTARTDLREVRSYHRRFLLNLVEVLTPKVHGVLIVISKRITKAKGISCRSLYVPNKDPGL